MDNGILNSVTVKATIGGRLMDARGDMTRKELCEKLNKCNIYHPDKEISEDVLKMWELGRNTINIEWIPAVCHVLHCDVGYLFGDYPCKKRIISDVQTEIGLSEEAIQRLSCLRRAVIEAPGCKGGEYSRQRLQFYSAFIADYEIFGLIDFFPANIWKIEERGMSEEESTVFQNEKQAINFHRFEASQGILRFIERFINGCRE